MSSWTTIPCLLTLRDEFNTLNPNRDKGADGTIGDSSHTSSSDHTPDEDSDKLKNKDSDKYNEVHALDIDSTGPWPCASFDELIQYLVSECRKSGEAGKDRGRLRYIIWNKKIYEASNGWAASTYTGSDPHTNHAHFSAEYATTYESDTSPWGLVEKFGDDVTKDEFKAWMTEWAGSADGKKALARAVFTWDPGDNATGAPNDGIKNPYYGVEGNTNATVGANYAFNQAVVASGEARKVNDRLDQIEVTLFDCDQKLNQLLDPNNPINQ